MNETSLDDQIAMVVRRLTATLDLPGAAVEHEVRLAFEEWDEATVRDFLPIFVERQTLERLRVAHR